MKFLGSSLLIVGLVFIVTAFSYVGGRVLLPELGLGVPDYMTWFWFNMIIVVCGVVARLGGMVIMTVLGE